jgi:hypothetical protein
MGHIGQIIAGPHSIVVMYAQGLLKDVTPEMFRVKPKGIDTNSAAFNYGHLSIYPERVLEMIGRSDLAKPDQQWTDWFAAGKPGLDDPEGKIYPAMNEITERFFSRYQVAVKAVAEADDSVWEKPNPSQNENFRKMVPTIGMVVAFLLDGHCQSHLGQVSAWRRCMGLPSAF